MIYLLLIFGFLAAIYTRWKLSILSIGLALNLGAVIACFSSPFIGAVAVILFAYLSSGKSR